MKLLNIFNKNKSAQNTNYKKLIKSILDEKFEKEISSLTTILKHNIYISKIILLNYFDEKYTEEEKFSQIILINKNNFDFVYDLELDNNFIGKFVNFSNIDKEFNNLFQYMYKQRKKWFAFKEEDYKELAIQFMLEQIAKKNGKNISDIKNLYSTDKELSDKVNKEYEKKFKPIYPKIYPLISYELFNKIYTNNYITIIVGDKTFFYVKEKKNLGILKDLSLGIKQPNNYEIVGVSSIFFNYMFSEIIAFEKINIAELKEIKNEVLKSYLISIMINDNFGDLVLYGKYNSEGDTIFNNFSVQYNKKFRYIDTNNNISDFDNLLDDLEVLGFSQDGTQTFDNFRCGDFGFRAIVTTKDGTFVIVIRKNEGEIKAKTIEGKIKFIEEASGLDNLSRYIFDTEIIDNWDVIGKLSEDKYLEIVKEKRNSGRLFLNPRLEYKFYSVNYPMPYTEEENNSILIAFNTSTSGIFIFNAPMGHFKTTTIQTILNKYIKDNIEAGINKNIITLENPPEGENGHMHQVVMRDELKEELEMGIGLLKRGTPDIALFGEIKTGYTLGKIVDMADSTPLLTTMHVTDVEGFLNKFKEYSRESGISYITALNRTKYSICQLKTTYETNPNNKEFFIKEIEKFTGEEKDFIKNKYFATKQDLISDFLEKLSLKKIDLNSEEIKLKESIMKFIDFIVDNNILIIKEYIKPGIKLTFESIRNIEIKNWLSKYGGDDTSKIYEIIGYERTRLYQLLTMFLDGKIILQDFNFGEYSSTVISKVLEFTSRNYKKPTN